MNYDKLYQLRIKQWGAKGIDPYATWIKERKMNPTNKVQTRISVEEACNTIGMVDPKLNDRDQNYFRAGWQKALDSVIMPAPLSESSGKRFEVGDLPDFEDALEESFWRYDHLHKRSPSHFSERDAFKMVLREMFNRGLDPEARGLRAELLARRMDVESQHKIIMELRRELSKFLPQTVDLTDDEKIEALAGKGVSWLAFANAIRDHKTLDQLCAEYNVPMTREI